MSNKINLGNTVLPLLFAWFVGVGSVFAQDTARLDDLFDRLGKADAAAAKTIEAEIELELSKSGSAAMDLLFKRGKDSLNQGNLDDAFAHFSALTDHAPEFSEGWYWRARTLVELERPGPALEDLEQTLRLEPRHYAALVLFGSLLEEFEMEDLALEAYQMAQGLHPHLEGVKDAMSRLEQSTAGAEL